jgi:tRNA-dihydrouridine synthase
VKNIGIMLLNQPHRFAVAPMMDWTNTPFLSEAAPLFSNLRHGTCAKRVSTE